MRVVISPDKFAGTLTAVQAATAIAEGWGAVRPQDELVITPLADGGEGTIAVVAHARADAVRRTVEVADARGIATSADWLSLPDGTALVEAAQACGLSLLPPVDRDPLRTTTYGVGQLLRAVLDTGPARVVVGLGGSATVDGGAGMAAHLTGHGLRRADGNAVKVGGRWVAQILSVRAVIGVGHLPPVVIASDVTNPLLGPDGAARVFGPQKGADADAVAELESALTSWAGVVERDLDGGPWRDLPGAGAAGGLGFALMAFLGGQVHSGARVIADMVGLDVAGADVVITGEGSLDAQTLAGKGPAEVRRLGMEHGARTVAVAGRIDAAAGQAFDIAEPLGPEGMTLPREMVVAAAARAAHRVSAELR
ncbi:MAG TPA: glycerate kinase [Euzebya sp.]|nr:glycerate kinase [Euzebya sp.]